MAFQRGDKVVHTGTEYYYLAEGSGGNSHVATSMSAGHTPVSVTTSGLTLRQAKGAAGEVYEAAITQASTDAPTVRVHRTTNSPIRITWTRTAVGVYRGTPSVAISANSVVGVPNTNTAGCTARASVEDVGAGVYCLIVRTFDATDAAADALLTNGLLRAHLIAV
jgi:hypothetical protein